MTQNIYDARRINETPEILPFFYDIDPQLAISAYTNISHYPERGGSLIRAEYAQVLLNDKATIENSVLKAIENGATVDPYWPSMIDHWFTGHRIQVKNAYVSYLNSLSVTASWFITGAANFPTERNRKRSQTADKRYAEISELRQKLRRSILECVLPYGDGSHIRSDDPEAIKKLEEKKRELEHSLRVMKLANLICRKHQKTKFNIDNCADDIATQTGLNIKDAKELLRPSYSGRIKPFEQYSFTNTNNEIKRIEKRIEELSYLDNVYFDDLSFDNGIVCKLSEDKKIEIHFPEKPSIGVIDSLKTRSFKWSRYRSAWVRKLTKNSYNDFTEMKKFLSKVEF